MERNLLAAALFMLMSNEFFPCFVRAGDCSPNVDQCEWEPWNRWSDCSKSCAGGTRKRDRSFCCKKQLAYSAKLCMENCGWDYESRRKGFYGSIDCNTICYNGGTYVDGYYNYCRCPDRYEGTCCRDVITCGRPSSLSHGSFYGSDFTYGGRVRYSCNSNYGMVDTSKAVRTCVGSGYWSGSLPTCLYAAYCNSSPCRNGGRCNNLIGVYKCYCKAGWIGKNCEIDIQPPVVRGCPTDRDRVISNMTTREVWTEPTIIDPHRTRVHNSKNYRTSSFDFPWGEYTVYYHGVKPSNGLSANCSFKISVKPFACKKMSPPVKGIMMCNGWRKEYSQICVFECKAKYTLPPGFKQSDIFVCGATGNWLPNNPVPQCVPHEVFPYKRAGNFSTCTNSSDRKALANLYIDRLKASAFNGLCHQHHSDCVENNVIVTC